MAIMDARGLATSSNNATSLERYEQSLNLLHGYYGDPLTLINQAIQEDPEFVLGHALRAGMLIAAADQAVDPLLRESVEAGKKFWNQANERERRHLCGAQKWLEGDFNGSLKIYGDIALDYPRDSLALQVSHICDFLLGRSSMLRDRIARALPAWSERDSGFSYLLGMHAFGLEETNFYQAAEEQGRRALDLNPRDPWAIHAVAHVMEMQGRQDEGKEWLSSRRDDWASDNMFAGHNWWHLALFHLDREEYEEVLRLYDEELRGNRSAMALDLVDASALLWRLHLLQRDVGPRWEEIADLWAQSRAPGHYAFNDVHAMMAYLGAGRLTEANELMEAMEAAARGPGTNAMMTAEVGLPVARGFIAFETEDYEEAIRQLLDIRVVAHRFGGSHAQRDIIDLTLLEAALRARALNLARALSAERMAIKPTGMRNRYLAQRATAL